MYYIYYYHDTYGWVEVGKVKTQYEAIREVALYNIVYRRPAEFLAW